MSLFSTEEMRAIELASPGGASEVGGQAPAAPGHARALLLGAAYALDFALVAGVGLATAEAFVAPGSAEATLFDLLAFGMAMIDAVAFHMLGSYSLARLRRPLMQLARMSGAWTIGFAGLIALVFFAQLEHAIPRVWLLSWYLIGFNALALARIGLATTIEKLAATGRFQKRVVVVGGGELARDLIRDLSQADPAEFKLIGVFDDRNDDRSPNTLEGVAKLGGVDDLVEFARATRVDLAVFAMPITAEQRILHMLRKLWVLPIDVRLAAHANRLRFRPRSYSYVGRTPMLDVFDKPLGERDVIVKMALDKIVGVLALIVLSPLMLATAIAIKLESKGPVLFRQKRYGFNNELVEVFKFRSMYVEQLDPTASKLVTRGDPRVTRVGRIMRKTSIDELPQLFNVVFKGNLSLVGPRPHAVQAKAADLKYDEVVDGYFARHRVKPGITGWAQINGWRGETDTPEKIQARVDHDLYYIENWSAWFDLYILVKTPFSLLDTKNAY